MGVHVKLFGERNTGTNYLERLLKLNFQDIRILRSVVPQMINKFRSEWLIDAYFQWAESKNLGWKHTLPNKTLLNDYAEHNDLLVITLTKNPYSFLLSLYRKPYHAHSAKDQGFRDFLQAPWPVRKRDNCGDLTSPMALWNCKNAAYLHLSGQKFRHIGLRYEDLLASPGGTIQKISESLPGAATEFRNVRTSTKEKGKDFAYYRDYYVNEKWKDKLDADILSLINEELDHEIVRAYGYEILG